MADYKIEKETTVHLKGMAIGDSDFGSFILETHMSLIWEFETSGLIPAGAAPHLIEKVYLFIHQKESFIKATLYGEKKDDRTTVYSIPFIPMLCGEMARNGYITEEEALELCDSTGFCASSQKQINRLAGLNDIEPRLSLAVNVDKCLLVSYDLFPWMLPLLGLYDNDMTYEEFCKTSENKVTIRVGLGTTDPDFIMQMDKMSRDGIIKLAKTYYEYLQWKNK